MTKPVVPDLCDRMHDLWLRYNVVFREPTHANPPYVPLAEALAKGLLREDKDAVILARTVIDVADQERPDFWKSPLGRLLFAAGGYPHDTVPQTLAAAVLGCTRQWVNTLSVKGALTPTEDHRAVFTDGVRSLLKVKLDDLVN